MKHVIFFLIGGIDYLWDVFEREFDPFSFCISLTFFLSLSIFHIIQP
jgi:hypothetical protein